MGPLHVFRFLKLLAAGVVAVATGVWLLANPTVADYMPGVGALAAGLVILAFGAWVAFRCLGHR